MTTHEKSVEAVEARPITEHRCYSKLINRLAHRHWFHKDNLMPTCERCGTPIDCKHKETGPVSWEPEDRTEFAPAPSDQAKLIGELVDALSVAVEELEYFVEFARRQCEFEGDADAGLAAVANGKRALALAEGRPAQQVAA